MLAAPELNTPVHRGGEEEIAQLGAAFARRVERERRDRAKVTVKPLKYAGLTASLLPPLIKRELRTIRV